MATGASNLERNLPLVRARFDRDLADSIAHVEERVAHLFSGAFALLNPLARTIFHHLGIPETRRRVEVQFDLHQRAARDVPDLGLDGAVAKHVGDVLANDDFLARIDPKHARASEARDIVAGAFASRLLPISRVLHEGVGDDFDALVRSVLPRHGVERVLADQLAAGRRLLALAEEDGLVRMPRMILTRVLPVSRGLVEWYEGKVEEDIDRIYGAAPPPG